MLRVMVLSAAILPILAGCAAPKAELVNAKGEKAHCSAMGLGLGALVALGMEHHCVEEAKKQGYHEVTPGAAPAAAASAKQTKQQQ